MAKVNEDRHRLFTSGETLDNIPPTQAALFEHMKRASLQASIYWNQASFQCMGWQREDNGNWMPRTRQHSMIPIKHVPYIYTVTSFFVWQSMDTVQFFYLVQ